MRITFWGAAGTVTGSRFVVEAADRRMLVDCGLFQEMKALRQRNWEPFPVDPSSIDAVVLTTPTSTTAATCRRLRVTDSEVTSGARRPPPISVGSCCPTPLTSKRRTPASRIAAARAAMTRRCRSTPATTPNAPSPGSARSPGARRSHPRPTSRSPSARSATSSAPPPYGSPTASRRSCSPATSAARSIPSCSRQARHLKLTT